MAAATKGTDALEDSLEKGVTAVAGGLDALSPPRRLTDRTTYVYGIRGSTPQSPCWW